MLDQSTGFAKYSKNLCWIVSFIGLLLSILTFTGDSGNATVGGFLWLALAFAFAISAISLSKREERGEVASTTESTGE
ncbi:MAG: hypothetical protein GKR91_10990 [Pseudomonadales bacterium]|nr:hypothetical protein [Pseudomonadales bacterium]